MSNRIIIVGAGHNGLVCATYLARAGRDVLVLEAADQPGGAAITREFAPDYRVSACAHLLNVIDGKVVDRLSLSSRGLEMAGSALGTVALDLHGDHVYLSGERVSGENIRNEDRAAYIHYRQRMTRFAKLLRRINGRTPPRLGSGDASDLLGLAGIGIGIRRLGRSEMREFLRIAGINIYDVLDEHFEDSLLKGALCLDGLLGNHLGPRSNNSVLNTLHRMTGMNGSADDAVAVPAGGMGAVVAAMANAASESGVSIRTGSEVERILTDGDGIKGVVLSGGDTIGASVVISNADPKTTFLDLVGADNLEAGFAHRVRHIRTNGNVAKLHLALSALPQFSGLDTGREGDRLVITPDPEYVERAFNHAKYGEFSEHPVLEIVIPTVHDESLAPQGHHVLSANVMYAPYDLKRGWDAARDDFKEKVIGVLDHYAPGIRKQIVSSELLSPLDIEQEFRIKGGHWHHGELALDTFLMMRPIPGMSQYTTPVDGLYLCGAGCHPGGGVMGTAGRNAARVVQRATS